jgi:hypothetical protein
LSHFETRFVRHNTPGRGLNPSNSCRYRNIPVYPGFKCDFVFKMMK